MNSLNSERPQRYIPYIVVLAIAFFAFSGFVLKSSLNDITSLSRELSSAPNTIYTYTISQVPPFKYRLLFSTIIKNTYAIFSEPQNTENFYIVYVIWSGLFYIAATLTFYLLLLNLKFSRNYAIIGVLLFLLSPAVLFAYSMPVHTREDFLAYTILNVSLICLLKENFKGILLFAFLGVLCRETLLIIPLLFLIYSKCSLAKRLLVAGISFSTFFAVRYLTGYKEYNVLELGLYYNIGNFAESVGFIFLVFSFMWPVFLNHLWNHTRKEEKKSDDPISFIMKSALPIFALIFITTLIGGRINELRLLFLMFPWVIALFLFYVRHSEQFIRNTFQRFGYKAYLAICVIVVSPLYFVVSNRISEFTDGIYEVPYGQWIVLTCISLFLFLSWIPFYIYIFKTTRFSHLNPSLHSK